MEVMEVMGCGQRFGCLVRGYVGLEAFAKLEIESSGVG
jgi:hypothetical protein